MHGTLIVPAIRRTMDAAFLNAVANDPAVRPHLAGDGAIDLAGLAADPRNVLLQSDCGGFLIHALGAGVYEVHSMFLPGNGTAPVRAMRAAQEWVFTRTDCHTIVSRVPKANRRAKGFAITGRLGTVFERDCAQLGPCEYVRIDLMGWAMGNAALEGHGEAFHDALSAAKEAAGSALPVHDHDAAHERAVGAAWLMIRHGQAAKGVGFYNTWAQWAGYAPIALLSASPVVVDVVDAVVGLNDNLDLEVLSCR